MTLFIDIVSVWNILNNPIFQEVGDKWYQAFWETCNKHFGRHGPLYLFLGFMAKKMCTEDVILIKEHISSLITRTYKKWNSKTNVHNFGHQYCWAWRLSVLVGSAHCHGIFRKWPLYVSLSSTKSIYCKRRKFFK